MKEVKDRDSGFGSGKEEPRPQKKRWRNPRKADVEEVIHSWSTLPVPKQAGIVTWHFSQDDLSPSSPCQGSWQEWVQGGLLHGQAKVKMRVWLGFGHLGCQKLSRYPDDSQGGHRSNQAPGRWTATGKRPLLFEKRGYMQAGQWLGCEALR